jgi:NAD-dependent SIR2 family protein deacetylase
MDVDTLLARAADLIHRACHLVVFTGAGVSTPSGIPDFRSPQSGLWKKANPHCEKCGGVLKPNVILFGEQLPFQEINAARRQARECDLMLVAGSSLLTSPACDLPLIARENGAQVIVINRQSTPIDREATLVIRADVATALPRIVSLLVSHASS